MSIASPDATFSWRDSLLVTPTALFFEYGCSESYHRGWNSRPVLELVHATVHGPGGPGESELNLLVPQCMSFGSVPAHMGLKGNSFAQTRQASEESATSFRDSPTLVSLPLARDTVLDRLREAVTKTKIESGMRPLIASLTHFHGWAMRQTRGIHETDISESGSREIRVRRHTIETRSQAMFVMTGTVLCLRAPVDRRTAQTGASIYLVPGALCQLKNPTEDDPQSEVPPAEYLSDGFRSYAIDDTGMAVLTKERPRWVGELMDNYGKILSSRRRIAYQDFRADDWTLDGFNHNLRICEGIVEATARRACKRLGWKLEITTVSTLRLT